MRPIYRGKSPQTGEFQPYDNAKSYLLSRFGSYCSYCERRIATGLAVEHIQPKGLPAYKHLEGSWNNFLLACINCNSTKKDKDIIFSDVLFPDRDNTFIAFEYTLDGKVTPSAAAKDKGVSKLAQYTLSLTGLDKPVSVITDENGKEIAVDRVSQRLDVLLVAQESKLDVDTDTNNEIVKQCVIRTALGYGFFSIWMTVFRDDLDMRNRLIDAFPGTRESGCFDPVSTLPISPHPNADNLTSGSKI